MNMNLADNNKLTLAGKVITPLKFSYVAYDENFYEFTLEVPRLSDNSDKIRCIVSEKIMDDITEGSYLSIEGQVRTFNEINEEGRKLLVFAFVRDLSIITEEELKAIKNPNEIELTAYLCKAPSYRETPFGREISDLLLAVNRAYKKSDYIPAIAWGRNAKYCGKLEVGSEIKVTGRLQSREYTKKNIVDGVEVSIPKVAYELSLNKVTVIKKDQE